MYYGLAIKVTAMDQQPTEIGITRKLYRPNLLFANSTTPYQNKEWRYQTIILT